MSVKGVLRKALLGAFSHRTLAILRWDLHFLRVRAQHAFGIQRRALNHRVRLAPRPLFLNLGSGPRDDEVVRLGARVLRAPVPIGQTAQFVRHLRQTLRAEAPAVLHCHHDVMSALYLLAAAGLPIRNRIVHVHNADQALPTPSAGAGPRGASEVAWLA